MATVLVDGKPVEISSNERLNGIQAARRAGVDIPHYCWHAGLSVVASCRMCLVETGTTNPQTGEVSMLPKLVPACQTPATNGTVFVTNSEKVRQARAMVEEDLLIDHPIDCPICDKAGECSLQDYHFAHGQSSRRADIRPFTSRRRDMGPTVTLFVDRCVMCSRCVRFCREISGTSELFVTNRGSHEEIDVFPGFPLHNKLAGNVVDLCPVGALGDKDFLYRQRVWFVKRHAGICTGCSTGCSTWIEENQDQLYRIKPRENPDINKWWMCDDGRYDYSHVHRADRLQQTVHREEDAETQLEPHELIEQLPQAFAQAGALAAVLSPFLTIEEAFLLASWIRSIDPLATLALGPIPVTGEDESFKGGFVIRREKCPNRQGVELVLRHFSGDVLGFDDFLKSLPDRDVRGIWFSGGYREPPVTDEVAEEMCQGRMVLAQDLFPSPLSSRVAWQIPAGAFAERDGSYVNHAGILQSVDWAIRPPSNVPVEGALLWRLLKRPGMYRARVVLAQMAAEMQALSSVVTGVPPEGMRLPRESSPLAPANT